MSHPRSEGDVLDQTTAWARAVVRGEIAAGELVQLAAERHIRDLVDGPARGLFWDPEAARHAIDFFPSCLTITDGAKAGEPFHLLPYTGFLTGSLYGWRRANGQRRFRTFWVETGKGQAKSPWAAALGLYEMRFCGVPRALVYVLGPLKDQANVLFKDAAAMARANVPGTEQPLEEVADLIVRGVGDNAWKIEWDGSDEGLGNCLFRPIASNQSTSGPKPRLVLVEEVHEFDDDSAIEMWSQALAKVPGDPLMGLLTNTPAADQHIGIAYSDYYASVVKGEFRDDTSLVFIATVDKKDKPFEDESCWPKSLPALGITFEVEKLRDEVAKARKLPSKALKTERLFFGRRTGAAESWIDEAAWEAVVRIFDESELVGLPLTLALDLSQSRDFTALAKVWEDVENRMGRGVGHLFASVRYWAVQDGIAERSREDKAPYDVWALKAEETNSGLIAVPGPVIGKDFVAAEVRDVCAVESVEEMSFDPAHIKEFIKACQDIGFAVWQYEGPNKPKGDGLRMVIHSQGTKGMWSERALWMPRSIDHFEASILKGEITIQDSPITRWCSSNAKLREDGQRNRSMEKKRLRGRIDGIVSLTMGVGAVKADMGDEQEEDLNAIILRRGGFL